MNDAMTIIVDTREQRPFSFATVEGAAVPFEVVTGTLETGDYSLAGYERMVCIERKSLADAFGTFGRDRERFEAELDRMARMRYAAVVIEADLNAIRWRPPTFSRLAPKTVFRSMLAWEQRFGVHFWAVPNRAWAEKWTYLILERFWRDATAVCSRKGKIVHVRREDKAAATA